jgi:hypothetical protein
MHRCCIIPTLLTIQRIISLRRRFFKRPVVQSRVETGLDSDAPRDVRASLRDSRWKHNPEGDGYGDSTIRRLTSDGS